jgi:hypothetical protein
MSEKFQKNQKPSNIFSGAANLQQKQMPESLSPEALKKLDENLEKKERSPMTKAQKDLQSLLFIGRLEKEIVISGFKFKMTTVNNVEQKSIFVLTAKADDNEKAFVLRNATLAYAISEINDIPIDNFIESEEENIDRRIEFFNNLSTALVSKLFDTYGNLSKQSNDMVVSEDIKN